ncbi:unnamed protein product [Sphagnum troendelagicum]|uniref:Uncharacterized protein n=1 Tax=Sphagnum troendelagicum TaxID=128251 RepID=A0ABP0TR84_9BRYO
MTSRESESVGPGLVSLNAKLRPNAVPGRARSVEIREFGSAGPGPVGGNPGVRECRAKLGRPKRRAP